jgi:aconitate hydratase
MPASASTPTELVEAVYARTAEAVAVGRERLGRPLTLAEKILFGHMADASAQDLERGRAYGEFHPDRWPCRTPPPRWRCCSS